MVRGKGQRVYISGPITDKVDSWLSFKKAAEFLRTGGHKVSNPMDIQDPPEVCETVEDTWVYYMKESLKLLVDCDCIYMLEGWEESKGARMEFNVAAELNIPAYFAAEDHKYV